MGEKRPCSKYYQHHPIPIFFPARHRFPGTMIFPLFQDFGSQQTGSNSPLSQKRRHHWRLPTPVNLCPHTPSNTSLPPYIGGAFPALHQVSGWLCSTIYRSDGLLLSLLEWPKELLVVERSLATLAPVLNFVMPVGF